MNDTTDQLRELCEEQGEEIERLKENERMLLARIPCVEEEGKRLYGWKINCEFMREVKELLDDRGVCELPSLEQMQEIILMLMKRNVLLKPKALEGDQG